MGQACPWVHQAHLTTCLWMAIALLQTGEVNLTRWLPYLPCRGQYAQSKQRHISRWLNNPRLNIHQLYKPLIRAALADWGEDCLYLSLDTSLFWDEYCLIRWAVVHRGRALPVAWRVLHHSSASVAFVDYPQVLSQAACCLPEGVKVVLLADRDFVHTDLMRVFTQQWHWHYRIRLQKDSWIKRAGRGWCPLKDFHFQHGRAAYFHNIGLHKDACYGPVHIIVGRNNVNGEFWAIVSDETTNLQTFAQFGLRFDIEVSQPQYPHQHETVFAEAV